MIINKEIRKALDIYLNGEEWSKSTPHNSKLEGLMRDHLQILKRGSWIGHDEEFKVFDDLNFIDMLEIISEIRD